MAKWRKLLEKLLAGSMDIRFDEFVLLLGRFGFCSIGREVAIMCLYIRI